MKGRLAGVQIQQHQDVTEAVSKPVILLDPYIEKALTNIHASRQEQVREYCCLRMSGGLKRASMRSYLKALAALESIGKDYKSITKEDMIAWSALLDKTYKPASAQLYRLLVKTFMHWVYHDGDEDAPFPECVKWIKARKLDGAYKKHVLSQEEAYKLIKTAYTQRDRALLFVLYESACRAGEILSLKIKDVRITQEGAEITIRGKTGQRTIPLIESVPDLQLWMSLHPFKENRDCPVWVTSNTDPRGMSMFTLYWHVKEAAKRAGLPTEISPHSLRHASATHLADVLNEAELRKYCGWTPDSKMTSKYVHPDEENIVRKRRAQSGLPEPKTEPKAEPTTPKRCPRCEKENSALTNFCIQCGAALDLKTALDLHERRDKADAFTANILAELMKRVPDLLSNIIAEQGGINKINNILGK